MEVGMKSLGPSSGVASPSTVADQDPDLHDQPVQGVEGITESDHRRLRNAFLLAQAEADDQIRVRVAIEMEGVA